MCLKFSGVAFASRCDSQRKPLTNLVLLRQCLGFVDEHLEIHILILLIGRDDQFHQTGNWLLVVILLTA